MNFLGHAYLARNNPELIAGNFAGDEFKGDLEKFVDLPRHIIHGVRLHRKIDFFTDTNANIRAAGKILQDFGVKKVAFIATDLILDYYLSANWEFYHNTKYEDFLELIYENTRHELHHFSSKFQKLFNRLVEYKWMNYYNSIEGIEQIIWQFSKRIGFENDLLLAFDIYKSNTAEINSYFKVFLAEIDTEIQAYTAGDMTT